MNHGRCFERSLAAVLTVVTLVAAASGLLDAPGAAPATRTGKAAVGAPVPASRPAAGVERITS